MSILSNFFGVKGKYVSSSGTFYHVDNIVNSFIPNPENIIKGGIDAPDGWSEGVRHYNNAIKTLIVPKGVKGFTDHFLRGWAVTESMVLSDSVLSIGQENGVGCVFANCYFPEIILPDTLKCLGAYAFGHCYIKKLIVPPTVKSKYNRQFKDSTIEELYLPKVVLEWEYTSIESAYGYYHNFHVHCNCNIIKY